MQKAATEVRALVPQLLQSLGNVASALGSPGIEGMTRHLERFELTGMRLQQDVEALAGGVGDATVIARRLADGNDYMGQVVGGLRGEDSGLGLPKVTAPKRDGRFKTHQRAVRAAEREGAHRDQLGGRSQARRAQAAPRWRSSGDKIYSALREPRRRAGAALPPVSSAQGLADRPAGRRPASRCSICRSLYATSGNIRKTLRDCRPARTSATRKRFCGCSTSCRASPTAT